MTFTVKSTSPVLYFTFEKSFPVHVANAHLAVQRIPPCALVCVLASGHTHTHSVGLSHEFANVWEPKT